MNRDWPPLLLYRISFASSFSWISTLIPFTVWFSLNSCLNCPFWDFMSGSSLTCFIRWSVLSLSSVIPNSFIQSNPNSGFVFFVVIKISKCFCLPLTFTFAIVFFFRSLFGCRSRLYIMFPMVATVLCY